MLVGIGRTLLGSVVKCVQDFDRFYAITDCDMLTSQVFSKFAVTFEDLRVLGR